MTWVQLLPSGARWPTGIAGFTLRDRCASCEHMRPHRHFTGFPFCGLGAPTAPPDGTLIVRYDLHTGEKVRGDEGLAWFRAMQAHAETRHVAPEGWCPNYTASSTSAAGENAGNT